MSDLYKKTYRGYLVDHHTPDHPGVGFEKLDAGEWERFIEEAKLDHLMLYCKDHWGYSYYDTSIGKKHPALGERDWVGELVPVLRRHGIEFTAYYCFEYDSYAVKAHPEWSTINRDDVPLVCGMPTNSSNARWGMPCYETDYRAYILGQLKEIVERFRSHGLDVSSEACGLPFVGSISYFWHMQRVARPLYEGDRRIPMVPFLVHGKADYAGTHTDSMRDILDGLLYGGFYCNDVTASTPIQELTDAYFMLHYPLNLLRDDLAVSYGEQNDWKIVRYASGAEIAVAFESEECRVTIGGQRLIENGSAMLPQEDGSTILYRCREEPYEDVRWHTGLPAGTRLTAAPMGVDLPLRTLMVEKDGCVPVDTELGVAYRVRREQA